MTLDSPQLDEKIGTTLIQHETRAAEREMSSRPRKSVFSTPPSYKCASVTDAFVLTQQAPVGRYVHTCAHTSWYAAPWHACSHSESACSGRTSSRGAQADDAPSPPDQAPSGVEVSLIQSEELAPRSLRRPRGARRRGTPRLGSPCPVRKPPAAARCSLLRECGMALNDSECEEGEGWVEGKRKG